MDPRSTPLVPDAELGELQQCNTAPARVVWANQLDELDCSRQALAGTGILPCQQRWLQLLLLPVPKEAVRPQLKLTRLLLKTHTIVIGVSCYSVSLPTNVIC